MIKSKIQLPKQIWTYIYTFDNTYYEKFNIVINELLHVTSMWRLYFHHQDLQYNFRTSKYLSLKQVKQLSNYWNKDFMKKSYTQSYKRYYHNRNKLCSPIHISDNSSINTYFPRLKANILSSKIIKNWEKNNMIQYNV